MATAISLTSADQFSVLPLDCLVESATNPRRTFDEAKLADLAETLEAGEEYVTTIYCVWQLSPEGEPYNVRNQ